MLQGKSLKTDVLAVRIDSDPAGVIDAPAPRHPAIVIHVGPSVHIACRRGGREHRGLGVHGDIDIIPRGMPSRWELKQRDTALVISLHSSLLGTCARERGVDPGRVAIVNRFQTRDPQIEHIGWALKAEMEASTGTGRLYLDSLATALASRLLERHSSVSGLSEQRCSMSGAKLRLVLSYIEDHLTDPVTLSELASVAGIGISHFKKVFRESVGLPVHQYVIRRRVERAKALLSSGNLSIGQVAAQTGFAHQSHLAHHIRRATGVSPRSLRRDFYLE
jgi:AraC family transcriptional regulator